MSSTYQLYIVILFAGQKVCVEKSCAQGLEFCSRPAAWGCTQNQTKR